ncbi:MAG TPA: hypothetical protein VFG69_04215 [Nannocystaceae bacterium]|nr:hypothetical protein [Nannocystaceae bacterium]
MPRHTLSVALFTLLAPGCFTPDADAPSDDPTGGDDTSSADDTASVGPTSATSDEESSESADGETSDPTGDPTDGDTDTSATDAGSTTGDDGETTSDDGATTSDDDSASTDAGESTGMPVETRVVFVTSALYSALVFPSATTVCQSLADDAGLTGTFFAWMSLGGFEPADDFEQFDGAYVLTDGSVVADDWEDLVDGTLQHAINRDENGDIANGIEVWTNTDDDGTILVGGGTPQNCTAFTNNTPLQTGRIGRTTASSDEWTDYAAHVCAGAAHIYCFEQ